MEHGLTRSMSCPQIQEISCNSWQILKTGDLNPPVFKDLTVKTKRFSICLLNCPKGHFLMAYQYSTKDISERLKEEVLSSIQSVRGWGSVEIFIQDFKVTQITEKNIKKPVPTQEI